MGEEINIDSMDDDAFTNATDEIFNADPIVEEEPGEESEVEVEDEQVEDEEDTHVEDQGSEEADSEEEESEDDSDEDGEVEDQADEDTDTQDAEEETEEANDTEDDFDYKAGYEEILAEFKAGGKDIKIDNIEDARKLMQMGAGFASNQRKIKPHLKIIKALKKNGLLDPEKVNHLIDVGLNNPEAIAKVLKDSGIDPLDIKTGEEGEYKPTNHEVSDEEFDLDQAIDGIKGSGSYDKSIAIMGEQWDTKSRKIISENPQIVSVINDHVESGVFDAVQSHVDKERALGRLEGVPDVEAYYNAVTVLKENGSLTDSKASDSAEPKVEDDSLKKEAKKKQVAKRNKKRKAAGPVKGKPAKVKSSEDFDDLSDEEFGEKFGVGYGAV